ncbi:hypothetical protein LCGC14_2991430 [marine sediment metagenome]|uniref:Uncharacterized protein n=1 Tax=marine sediment metagenome TaxID=412755 RepID=A0A0F8X3N7_9ZZZZ
MDGYDWMGDLLVRLGFSGRRSEQIKMALLSLLTIAIVAVLVLYVIFIDDDLPERAIGQWDEPVDQNYP